MGPSRPWMREVSELLGLWVSWVKTKIQAFNDDLDAAILSVPVCGKNVEVTERFTFLGNDIHVNQRTPYTSEGRLMV